MRVMLRAYKNILFTCCGSCKKRFVLCSPQLVITLHNWDNMGMGRGGWEEGELQRIKHPPQHGGSTSKKREGRKEKLMKEELKIKGGVLFETCAGAIVHLHRYSLDGLHRPQLLKMADNSHV